MALPFRQILGWTAVGLSTLAACFWAFWGIIENFHEGWYAHTLWENLALMMWQYLVVTTAIVMAALIAIRWPRIGSMVHMAAALAAVWRFHGAAVMVVYPFIVTPLVIMSIAYWIGRPQPRRLAAAVVLGLPLLTMVVCGAEPAYRVAGRMDDGDRSARRTKANGVDLIWAPAGPGWPDRGVSWDEAVRRCRYLSTDGTTLEQTPQDIWRLPTVQEAVQAMMRHGQNCGGVWDASQARASYQIMPDKESPLWDIYSMVIYWWTATEVNDAEAYIVVYNGQVWPRAKRVHWGYLAFRAVKAGGRE
jgi:hypothetical protein